MAGAAALSPGELSYAQSEASPAATQISHTAPATKSHGPDLKRTDIVFSLVIKSLTREQTYRQVMKRQCRVSKGSVLNYLANNLMAGRLIADVPGWHIGVKKIAFDGRQLLEK